MDTGAWGRRGQARLARGRGGLGELGASGLEAEGQGEAQGSPTPDSSSRPDVLRARQDAAPPSPAPGPAARIPGGLDVHLPPRRKQGPAFPDRYRRARRRRDRVGDPHPHPAARSSCRRLRGRGNDRRPRRPPARGNCRLRAAAEINWRRRRGEARRGGAGDPGPRLAVSGGGGRPARPRPPPPPAGTCRRRRPCCRRRRAPRTWPWARPSGRPSWGCPPRCAPAPVSLGRPPARPAPARPATCHPPPALSFRPQASASRCPCPPRPTRWPGSRSCCGSRAWPGRCGARGTRGRGVPGPPAEPSPRPQVGAAGRGAAPQGARAQGPSRRPAAAPGRRRRRRPAAGARPQGTPHGAAAAPRRRRRVPEGRGRRGRPRPGRSRARPRGEGAPRGAPAAPAAAARRALRRQPLLARRWAPRAEGGRRARGPGGPVTPPPPRRHGGPPDGRRRRGRRPRGHQQVDSGRRLQLCGGPVWLRRVRTGERAHLRLSPNLRDGDRGPPAPVACGF